MKAKIDAGLCTGCAACSETCPEVFVMGDDAIAKVTVDVIPAEVQDKARDAASSCPATCIEITE